ncbi:MAG: hypothetical protein JOZ40_14655, partial [Methylobacteriaceae bacterium]|nr:hypothetical protein [Methylobacteriaceae bacterium]
MFIEAPKAPKMPGSAPHTLAPGAMTPVAMTLTVLMKKLPDVNVVDAQLLTTFFVGASAVPV